MARTKRKVNKTKAVREYLASHPESAPREVADALSKQGVPVKSQYVSAIKSKMVRSDGGLSVTTTGLDAPAPRRRGRPPRGAASVGAAVGSSVAYTSLLEAKSFVNSIGGISEAKKVLDAYANLQ